MLPNWLAGNGSELSRAGGPAIDVVDLGRRYHIGELHAGGVTTLKGSLGDALRRRLQGRTDGEPADRTLWALRHATFSVQPGEAVAVVGANGSGKSTLLQILARAVAPTEGRARVVGRVAPLLAMGAGFNPEFTGRENVLMSGIMLGLSRREVLRRMEMITAFAQVDRFLDTPVKRYSSGMYVRLAFAVVAHVDADVLIADEILAVGDVEFQQRCVDRMTSMVARGKTLLFVSHNQAMVERICPRTIYLRKGEIVVDGPTAEVLSRYNADVFDEPPTFPGIASPAEHDLVLPGLT